ncbi:MAG: cyclic pyranopterin monophosphate synthase MoaC [Sporomusaceae bacterium]|nr:cyclic pyranopterin monophosphate synthase MoaC [Sporomusaceae bacterium]
MEFTHFNKDGKAQMVDVTAKNDTERLAVAEGIITMIPDTLELIQAGKIGKGDVLAVAQVAGIMAAKRTAELIPMCHLLLLTGVDLEFTLLPEAAAVHCLAKVKTYGKTGVEMEALTAVSAALLTIYDMCKAVDKTMEIGKISLLKKAGGKSGLFQKVGYEHV